MLRALLFGAFWPLAVMPLAFIVTPEFFPRLAGEQLVVMGMSYALAAAMALRAALRRSRNPSWLVAIIGWIAGFHVAPIFGVVLMLVFGQPSR